MKSARRIPGKFIIVNAQDMISGRRLAGEGLETTPDTLMLFPENRSLSGSVFDKTLLGKVFFLYFMKDEALK